MSRNLMSLNELLPSVQNLSHSDKLLLLHLLVEDLLKESGLTPLNTQNEFDRQGLHDSYEAAAVLAQALAEHKVATHG